VTGPTFTGRITDTPHPLLHQEVLEPQFKFEVEHLLTWYVAIEKVLALEYHRMGLITVDQLRSIGAALVRETAKTLTADPTSNMSDIAFALERYVESSLPTPVPMWHVDRSRNDLQACAQLMFARNQLAHVAELVLALGQSAHRLAAETTEVLMPGYTHAQSAQVITPGFYLAALSGEVLQATQRLLSTYDEINLSPLGAGAMAGQELPWDRARAASLLGFAGARPHALTAVASRDWVLRITGELSQFGVVLSRFLTDLITWAGSEYGFIDLPDEWAGISSAMPQKKNFPILERIRGRTGHLAAYHVDALLGQRNTAYSNSVEVSKETGIHLLTAFQTAHSAVALTTAVLNNMTFRVERMTAACEREFLGGFTLANLLTLNEGVPWRTAQVIAGTYILAAIEKELPPLELRPDLLCRAAQAHGFELRGPREALAVAFDLHRGVRRKCSAGSTSPLEVRRLLDGQAVLYAEAAASWEIRQRRVLDALAETDGLLAADADPGPGEA
jgi:argininosuccinate lyase